MKNSATNLSALLKQSAEEVRRANPNLAVLDPFDKGQLIGQAVEAKEGTAVALRGAIAKDASFGYLRGGWIESWFGGQIVQEHMLPHALVNAVVEGEQAEVLVAAARKFAASRKSGVTEYTPLAGIKLDALVAVVDGLDIVPWALVPESARKQRFSDISDPRRYMFMDFPRLGPTASMAIRHQVPDQTILFESHDKVGVDRDARLKERAARAEQGADLVRAMVAAMHRPIVALGGWSQFNDSFANRMVGERFQFSEALFDVNMRRAAEVALDGAATADLFAKLGEMRSGEKEAIRIGLDRLSLAFRRRTDIDKAIDLGIALESMLLHSLSPSDRGELKFRSAIRGSAFLGGTKQERLEVFNLLKDAYDLRSAAVHTGRFGKDKKRGLSPPQVLEKAAVVCARIARKLIEHTTFPNWETEFVIGRDD